MIDHEEGDIAADMLAAALSHTALRTLTFRAPCLPAAALARMSFCLDARTAEASLQDLRIERCCAACAFDEHAGSYATGLADCIGRLTTLTRLQTRVSSRKHALTADSAASFAHALAALPQLQHLHVCAETLAHAHVQPVLHAIGALTRLTHLTLELSRWELQIDLSADTTAAARHVRQLQLLRELRLFSSDALSRSDDKCTASWMSEVAAEELRVAVQPLSCLGRVWLPGTRPTEAV